MAYIAHIIVMVGLWIPDTLALNMILGRGKILFFGPVPISLVAAYGIYATTLHSGSVMLGLSVGLLLTLLASMFFSELALRLPGDSFGILSIAMHLGALSVVLNWTEVTRGALGISQIPRFPFLETLSSFTIVMVVLTVLWILLMLWVNRSWLGRAASALGEDRFSAESLGISRRTVYTMMFLLYGLGAYVVNVFYPQYVGLLHPNDYGYTTLVLFIMYVVAGKPGSVLGVTLSVVVLTILKEGLRFLPLPLGVLGPLRLLLFGVILIAAVYYRRNELFPRSRTV